MDARAQSSRNAPVDVTGLTSGAVGVSVGVDHSCARMADESLRCWGANQRGQLGAGPQPRSLVQIPVTGDFAPDVDAATGWYHTCIRRANGTVMCTGMGAYGQIGDGAAQNRATFTQVPGLTGVARIANQ